jgi:DNA-binding NtrC family response regulator
MVSGTTNEEMAKRALALGAFDYVVKPVDFVYLDNCIAAALAMKQVER